MSAVSEFGAKVSAHNDKIDTAVTGLQTDIDALKAKITELQNTPGAITPEDQTLLNDIESRAAGIATKLEALDAQTEHAPVAPPA